ncbi:hypothetical protein KEM48_005914 [Puccinia striiformis f. sp. tritici PST-130]|nr:hypothetical protein KEM48_005914 [Puccinia striiformis f. sp. tritici PST-130]
MNPDGFWSTHAHPELNLKLRVKDLAKMTSQALLVVRPMYHHSRPVDHPQRTSEDQQEPSRTGPTTDYLNRINSSISSFAPGRRNLHVGSLIASCLSAKLGLLNPVLKRDRGNNVDRISIGLSGFLQDSYAPDYNQSINGLREFYDIRSSVAASLSKDTGAETWVNSLLQISKSAPTSTGEIPAPDHFPCSPNTQVQAICLTSPTSPTLLSKAPFPPLRPFQLQ